MEPTNYEKADWLWWLRLVGVAYIALIGIFAIEEINGRNETMRIILAEEARVSAEAVGSSRAESAQELKALREVRHKLVALIVSGAQNGETLKELQHDLVMVHVGSPPPAKSNNGWSDGIVAFLAKVLLKDLSAIAGSGQILGVLVITASVGGALVTLSLRRKRDEEGLRTVIRAIGGGIVCYLAIDGGTIPLSPSDVAVTTHAATASLYGFLAGMFSERVFRLLSDLVDAFLSRITPAVQRQLGAADPARTDESVPGKADAM